MTDKLSAAPLPGVHRPGVRFLLAHPAHLLALGLGSGLSPVAPGTVGTLWAWLAFVVLDRWLSTLQWAWVLLGFLFFAWWAATLTARKLQSGDPGVIVCDEVLAFWLVLWMLAPAGLGTQVAAFALFRFFDAAKPGPVGWAESLFEPRRMPDGSLLIGWREGFGVLFDDLVAAFCTLFVFAVWRAL